ncbi:MAG TPA: glycoside hydrolase domain-containing protein [Xanthobacteraceae bacterium]|nr:glycoside hydrolase domain-containing protein [Xanthobacteraceae bacterium]
MSTVSRRVFTAGLLAGAFAPRELFGKASDPGRIAIIDTPKNAARCADKLAACGIKVVVRYFARKPQPGLAEKIMAADGNMIGGVREPTILIRHGISLVSLYQYRNNLAQKFLDGLEDTGSAKAEALADAQAALEQARLVGQPEGSAIYFGVDFNASKSAQPVRTGNGKGNGGGNGNVARPPRDVVEAVLEYFRLINRTVGQSYAIGVYGNGFINRLLREEKLVAYNWISASRAHDGTAEFYNSGEWHLFQNQIDRRWFAGGKCAAGLDLDTNVQNPRVTDIGAWGAGPVDPARTQAIFDQRRFVRRATPVVRQNGTAGSGERLNCRVEARVLKQGNVRVLAQSGNWTNADIDEDGSADGLLANSDLTASLAVMPAWSSLS